MYPTENCDLLKHLLPDDLALVDRGFSVQELVGLYCAQLKYQNLLVKNLN